MSGSPLDARRSATLVQRLRPVLEKLFDWLTLEPIWRAYRRFGLRGSAVVVIGLWFVWMFIVVIPLAIVGAILSVLGLVSNASSAITGPMLLLATGITAYGTYNAYRFVDDRKTVFQYQQNLDMEKTGKSFDYLDSGDDVVRGIASANIAIAMEETEAPGQVIKQAGLDKDEAAFVLIDLFHDDDDDVRRNASEAVAYFSREFPFAVAQYRDDIFAAMTYPDSIIQTNAAIIGGNMALAEPRLSDEVVDNVEQIVDDSDPEVREGAALALGLIRTDRARELLERLEGDSNPDVRQRAAQARKQQEQGETIDVDAESTR